MIFQTLISLAIISFGFYFVYDALKTGRTTLSGEGYDWSSTKKEKPVLFYFTVATHFIVGAVGMVLLYNALAGNW